MRALEGRVAIVTGGGSGIGRASAMRFAAEGCRVMVADCNEAGSSNVDEMEASAGTIAFTATDVSDAEQVRSLVTKVVRDFGRLDILFNAAGIYPLSPRLLETSEAVWEKVLNVNLKGCFLLCREAIPELLKTGEGAIITVSSIAALRGTSYCVPYAVSKAGIIQLTKAIGVEFGGAGLRCNCIVPGLIDTPMSRRTTGTSEELSRRSQQIPLARIGTADDVAELALFLVSRRASFINGEAITIDGGAMAR